jgi:hypothetical protein
VTWWHVAWIVVAMVAARSAAMGFNRLVDAAFDARNPRTAMREIPRGMISRGQAIAFVGVSSAVFVFAAGQLNWLCLVLSPVALAIVFWYSLAKRYTTWTQAFLGLAMAVAPVGGWLASAALRGVGAVAARARHRALGGRVRRALRLPGRRVRPRARAAIDPGALRRGARAVDLARDARGHGARHGAARRRRAARGRVSGRGRARRRAVVVRAVARVRDRPVAGEAGLRPERVRRRCCTS